MDTNNQRMDRLRQRLQEMSALAVIDPILALQLEGLRVRLSDPLYKVVVAGHFSSGKSTFLNALMGNKVLISRSGETTSCATRVYPVAPEHELADTIRIHYRNGEMEVGRLSGQNSLLVDATTLHGSLDRPGEIRLVEIYYPLVVTSEPICFVDTPGGNGMTPHLFDATKEEIQSSSTIVFMMSDRGITAYDSDLIEYIRRYQERVFFVVNQLDRVSQEERPELLTSVSVHLKSIFRLDELPVVWGVSSSQALEAKLSGDDLKLQASGFDHFERKLLEYCAQSGFVSDHLHNLERAVSQLEEESREQQEEMESRLKERQERYNLQVKRQMLQLSSKYRELERSVRDYIEMDTEQLLAELDEKMKEWVNAVYQPFSTLTLKNAQELSHDLRNIYQQTGGDGAVLFERIEERINGYDQMTEERFVYAFASFAGLIDQDLDRLSASVPGRNREIIEPLLQFELGVSPARSFAPLIESLEKHKVTFYRMAIGGYREQFNQLKQMYQQLAKKEQEEQMLGTELPGMEREFQKKQKDILKISANYQLEVNKEGPMPFIDRWTEEVEVPRNSISGFGLRDWLFGKKKKEVTRTDDSKQRQWKARIQEHESRYRASEQRLSSESEQLQQRISSSKIAAVRLKREAEQVRKQMDEKVLEELIPGLQRSYRQHANLINSKAKHHLEETALYTVMTCQKIVQEDRATVRDRICEYIKESREAEEQRLMDRMAIAASQEEEFRS
ncbi:GTP-binding protein EngB required for normal cell division/gas vesicle protein [Fontibacillus solani]|uniref:GTP-binding protein EngB required for normal cell division/gas vesicle protein n=1 Tax=Fontibacillus solani TaxID=1572857 RepID=A0A7W3SVZ9_9BACL|nr:dynamin family protein [Fontibacillus solani]MBA9087270.1 GTP-binding protein EngB required for normal cell division/gas vesicle protein [Fontibacillus solani]